MITYIIPKFKSQKQISQLIRYIRDAYPDKNIQFVLSDN